MPITVNEGGVLYDLSKITVNENGTLYNLDTVHSNESGVLQEIYSAKKQILGKAELSNGVYYQPISEKYVYGMSEWRGIYDSNSGWNDCYITSYPFKLSTFTGTTVLYGNSTGYNRTKAAGFNLCLTADLTGVNGIHLNITEANSDWTWTDGRYADLMLGVRTHTETKDPTIFSGSLNAYIINNSNNPTVDLDLSLAGKNLSGMCDIFIYYDCGNTSHIFYGQVTINDLYIY